MARPIQLVTPQGQILISVLLLIVAGSMPAHAFRTPYCDTVCQNEIAACEEATICGPALVCATDAGHDCLEDISCATDCLTKAAGGSVIGALQELPIVQPLVQCYTTCVQDENDVTMTRDFFGSCLVDGPCEAALDTCIRVPGSNESRCLHVLYCAAVKANLVCFDDNYCADFCSKLYASARVESAALIHCYFNNTCDIESTLQQGLSTLTPAQQNCVSDKCAAIGASCTLNMECLYGLNCYFTSISGQKCEGAACVTTCRRTVDPDTIPDYDDTAVCAAQCLQPTLEISRVTVSLNLTFIGITHALVQESLHLVRAAFLFLLGSSQHTDMKMVNISNIDAAIQITFEILHPDLDDIIYNISLIDAHSDLLLKSIRDEAEDEDEAELLQAWQGALSSKVANVIYDGMSLTTTTSTTVLAASHPPNRTGAIVGAVLGSIILCSAIGFLAWRWRKKQDSDGSNYTFANPLSRGDREVEVDADVPLTPRPSTVASPSPMELDEPQTPKPVPVELDSAPFPEFPPMDLNEEPTQLGAPRYNPAYASIGATIQQLEEDPEDVTAWSEA
ncbi:uncharacterized protein MONBRDRAFT_33785 [Monosiga brevicollis MX1]|uniref:Uncharacterized protein n=1 Tax=Monosiga brevicollis TaxID=81824 RepID=A9V7H7_MONBE|nr:uncharacterized protein MONBRDRAFT_33785 [Monosiga brevicollis MX1]EDQ86588.1 predicted protein [Monosiga brevicollis MX1]|eukprot:XP_001748701.1 hypothetical protein [Monosiga brevicollis MX1]